MTEETGDRLRKDRLSVLDQSLLFLSSFLSFFFGVTIFYINPPGGTALSSLSVFVVVTTIFPLYVGVMRGGVESADRLRERVRGWVYLLFGGGMFLVVLVFHIVTSPVTPSSPVTTALFNEALALVELAVTALVTVFTVRFVSWSYKAIEGARPSGPDLSAIYGTMGAVYVSILFFIVIAFLGKGFSAYPITDPEQARIITIVQSFFLLFPLVLVEFNCHHELLVAKADAAYQEIIAKNLKLSALDRNSIRVKGVLVLMEIAARPFFMLTAGINRKSPLAVCFVVFAIVFASAESLPSSYFDLAIAVIVISGAILFYGLWKHVKGIWDSSGESDLTLGSKSGDGCSSIRSATV
ncbi:MAG: hypothetical protein ABSB53_04630 [Nitrososphaerales archaeon]